MSADPPETDPGGDTGKIDSSVIAAAVGGVTSLLALLTGVGLTADRLAVVFNGGAAKGLLIGALLSAVASVGFGLLAVAGRTWKHPWAFSVTAVAALTLSLTLGVFVASSSFSDGGRPTITKVAVASEGESHATLTFTVTAEGVMSDNLLRAFASWVPDAAGGSAGSPAEQRLIYVTTLRPDNSGEINQEVSLVLQRQPRPQRVRLQVYWDRPRSAPSAVPATDPSPNALATVPPAASPDQIAYGALCRNQQKAPEAAACTEVAVPPAVIATPSATPATS